MNSIILTPHSPANPNWTFANNSPILTVNNGGLHQETNQPLLFGAWATTPFFVFSILFFVLFLILTLCGYLLDRRELKECDVVFVEPLREEDSFIYSVSLKIRQVYYKERVSDIIMRIRGSLRDSPMILFRDSHARVIRAGKMVNIGFAVPFELGNLQEISIAGDNSWSGANEKLFSFSDVSIRKLDKITLEQNNPESIKARLQTWHANETVKYWTKGSFFNSTSSKKQGQIKVIRARSSFISLKLDEEDDELIQHGFLSLHYIDSLIPRWHEAWSDYSHQDIFMIMKLDLLTGMLFIVCIYAFGLNWSMFGEVATSDDMDFRRSVVDELVKFGTWMSIVEKDEFLFKRVSTIFHSFMVAIVSASLLIPISFIWKKLFGVIGGKGFYKRQQSGEINRNGDITVIPRPLYNSDNHHHALLNLSNRSLVLRTLECRHRHSTVDTYALKSRHFRMETVITNCEPDDVTARVIAFIRTKLDKLDDDDVDTGAENVRNANTLHETRTLTSDIPAIDVPELVDNGNNNIIGVVRFCERIIQQVAVPYYVMDNSLIAECFIVTHKLNQHPQSLNELPLQNKIIGDRDDLSKSSQSTRYYEAQNQVNVQIGSRSSSSDPSPSYSFYTSDGILQPSGGLKETYQYQHMNDDKVEDKSGLCCCGRRSSLLRLRFKKINKIVIFIAIAVILNFIAHLLIYFPFCTGCSQFTVTTKPINLEHAALISFIFLLFLYPIFCINLIALISLFFQLFSATSEKQESSREEEYKI